jgi:hypothetical protein
MAILEDILSLEGATQHNEMDLNYVHSLEKKLDLKGEDVSKPRYTSILNLQDVVARKRPFRRDRCTKLQLRKCSVFEDCHIDDSVH